MVEVKVPTVGESIQEVQIGQWLKREGEWIAKDENLVDLETEKASVQVPLARTGILKKIRKQAESFAAVGEAIADIEPSRSRLVVARKARPAATDRKQLRPHQRKLASCQQQTYSGREQPIQQRCTSHRSRRPRPEGRCPASCASQERCARDSCCACGTSGGQTQRDDRAIETSRYFHYHRRS